MKFTISRDNLLKPLQLVAGVVERRQTMPVLANVLLTLKDKTLSLTGTDLEVEIVARVEVSEASSEGDITVPARKFLDIVRSLPDGANVDFSLENQKVTVKSGRSRFTLSTMPASEFPAVEESADELNFVSQQKEVKYLIDRTSFAMAQQDVRYYLNGMLWELRPGALRVVATDGHRLAMCTRPATIDIAAPKQAILPRKGVVELSRLLEDSDDEIQLVLGSNHFRASTPTITFTSKLVDAKFPDYERVLPPEGDKVVMGDRNTLKQAFARTAILSNEKYRGVRLLFEEDLLTVAANNPEQEEAEDKVEVEYKGESLELGFNASYLLDVANVMNSEKIRISLVDGNSSALLEEPEETDSAYVVMPMRL